MNDEQNKAISALTTFLESDITHTAIFSCSGYLLVTLSIEVMAQGSVAILSYKSKGYDWVKSSKTISHYPRLLDRLMGTFSLCFSGLA
jgi:hypothetical protein